MLNYLEINKAIQKTWDSLSAEPISFHIFLERPIKGKGYCGGGEYYLYMIDDIYILSYSERGNEYILLESKTFEEILKRIQRYMAEGIVSKSFAKEKKFKGKCLTPEERERRIMDLIEKSNNRYK